MVRTTLLILLLATAPAVGGTLDLQARIDAAAPGATLHVPAGVYGPVKTDKPIRLIGEAGGGAVIDGGGNSDCVVLVGGNSEIRGFTIRNSGSDLDRESCGLRVMGEHTVVEGNTFENVLFGVDLKQAGKSVVRNNTIGSMALDLARRGDPLRLFRSDDCLIEGNTIVGGRDALLWYSDRVTVRNNVSRGNRYGFHMMFANSVTLEGNDLSGNHVGVYLMYGKGFTVRGNRLHNNRGPSGYGIGFKEVDDYVIEGNLLTGNRVAVYLDGSPMTRKPGKAFVRGNAIACNDIGFSFLPAVRGNTITGNNLVDNLEQLAVQGRGNAQGNRITGNYWSDYGGYDRDRDGTGDQPYTSRKLFDALADTHPRLRLLTFSPAHDAVEFIGRALPAVAPETKFTDPAPRVRPVETPVAEAFGTKTTGLGWAAATLLGPVALLFGLVFRRGARNDRGTGVWSARQHRRKPVYDPRARATAVLAAGGHGAAPLALAGDGAVRPHGRPCRGSIGVQSIEEVRS